MATIQKNKQGQSDITEFKERGLQAAFSINLKIAKKREQHRYWHFDLNSGCGINEKVGCIGSPLAFLNAAKNIEFNNYYAGFCDINSIALKKLLQREEVKNNDRCFLFNGDNSSLVESIPDIIAENNGVPKLAMGMVLSAPNGTSVPIKQMAELAIKCPKIDFAINWNSIAFKRCIKAGLDYESLMDAITRLNKKFWLIREPQGISQFVLLIGRNFQIGDHKAMGFYHLHEAKGQSILEKMTFTRDELRIRNMSMSLDLAHDQLQHLRGISMPLGIQGNT